MAKYKVGDFDITVKQELRLGKGAFGYVIKCKHKDGWDAAAKHIDLMQFDETIVEKERIPLIKQLKHPNIIQMYDCHISAERAWIIMEICRCDLQTLLKDKGDDLTVDKFINISRQCCAGVAALHERDLVHRDIKINNYLCMDNGDCIKLSDFSLCKDLSESLASYMETSCGHRDWVAPELLNDYGGMARGKGQPLYHR